MGGPAAGFVDDALRLGLAYHAWPFTAPPATLDPDRVAYLIERTLAILPRRPPPEDPDD